MPKTDWLPLEDYFNLEAQKAWKIANTALDKVLNALNSKRSQAQIAQAACTAAISAIPGSSGPCQVTAAVLNTGFTIAYWILRIATAVSNVLFGSIVLGQNRDYERARDNAVYENVITNHQNIITTFYSTLQLKVMLGEISEGISKESESRRPSS